MASTDWLNCTSKLDGRHWNHVNFVALKTFKSGKCRKEVLKVLLENGLDVNMKNSDRQNFLHVFANEYAKENDEDAVEIGEILINHGISLLDVDRKGRKPVRYAARKNLNLYRLIFRKVVMSLDAEDQWLALDMCIDKFCSSGINSSVNRDGMNILHHACSKNDVRVLIVAISKVADLNATDNNGRMPIFYLKPERANYDNCVRIMVKEIARLNYADSTKKSVSKANMDFVKSSPFSVEYFDEFTKELKLMSDTKFYRAYSYYDVFEMSKSIKKLARIMRNDDFVKKLRGRLESVQFI